MILTCPCYEKLHIMLSLQLPDLKSWQKNSRSNFWNSALTVRQGEMVHQIRPGNKSEFAFMTRINSITPKLSTRFQSICCCCDNPNFSYYCSVYDKVFIETLQPEIHVRKISVKKNNQKEHLSPIHRGSHKCRNSLLKISWLMMVWILTNFSLRFYWLHKFL